MVGRTNRCQKITSMWLCSDCGAELLFRGPERATRTPPSCRCGAPEMLRGEGVAESGTLRFLRFGYPMIDHVLERR